MFIIDSRRPGAKNPCYLLQRSYREDGRVKHETIANLSPCSEEEIAALKLALQKKQHLSDLGNPAQDIEIRQGRSAGAVILLLALAIRLGITRALGSSFQGLLALWQVIARVLEQGSRLSAVRLAQAHEATSLLGFQRSFDEDDLYENLGWLSERQETLEKTLFQERRKDSPPNLFLYDVTSTYLEGTENDLGEFGYNRDKKKGKEQIVIGLLCDEMGVPVSVEAFPGNTQDVATFGNQIKKAADRFDCKKVTFVGDRGMIKSAQQEDLAEAGFTFITALTKPQIQTLLKDGTIQLDLFDTTLKEVEGEGKRYVLRRNPSRAKEIAESRQSKLSSIEELLKNKIIYLSGHKKAKLAVAQKHLNSGIKKLKLDKWLSVEIDEEKRTVALKIDETLKSKEAELDGCYVITTDLSKKEADAQTVHDRYKDLALVEWGFRSMKTAHLEIRPVYVRTESHTRGHVLVTMLAYMMRQELAKNWGSLDVTVEEGLKQLTTVCYQEIVVKGISYGQSLPKLRPELMALFSAAKAKLPTTPPAPNIPVASKKPLPKRRNMRQKQKKTVSLT